MARNREALRVDRGGSWAEVGDEGARVTRREAMPVDARAPWLGLRLARSLDLQRRRGTPGGGALEACVR